jgi:hypothetical protein
VPSVSVAPFLLIVISLSGMIFGLDAERGVAEGR